MTYLFGMLVNSFLFALLACAFFDFINDKSNFDFFELLG